MEEYKIISYFSGGEVKMSRDLSKLHFHRHKELEREYKIPEDHVIVDSESYLLIERLIKEDKKIEQVKKEEEAKYHFDEPIPHLYPNKFKVISNLKQIDEPGLYYFNDSMPDGLMEPVSKWIADVLNSKPQISAGYKNASISEIDFHNKYGYPVGKLNYKQDVCLGKREHLLSQGVNPLRIHQKSGILHNITLWGEYLRGIELLHCEHPTIGFVAVLMSIFDILFKEGEQRMLDYVRTLWQRRIIYEGRQHPQKLNLIYVRLGMTSYPYMIDLDKKEDIKRDFEYLKKHLIKD